MPSVLGKRTRSSAGVEAEAELKTQSTRAKRQTRSRIQTRTEIFNDENSNPFITRPRHNEDSIDSMDIDVEESVTPMETQSSPLKHGAAGKRIALSNAIKEDSTAIQVPTPQTPRHRDALSKKVQITPRHRVTISNRPMTPRTPRTPITPGGSITTIYSQARQLFTRSSEPGRLIGREVEKEELKTFAEKCVEKTTGGCIYVSGPPGTGKSAMVSEVVSEIEESATLRKTYVNCMSMKTSKDLFGLLLEEFCSETEVLEGEEEKVLRSMFISRKKNKDIYLITLDEVDHILTLDLEILYTLFEWSLQKSSRLILIGIANALDLTDRFLPRLKARNLQPQLLPFLPYTSAQIKNVITTRLKSLLPAESTFTPFLHPTAIELCSRKVSSQTGDLRKAFDIVRRAIDLVEAETKRKHAEDIQEQLLQNSPSKRFLEENVNLSSPGKATTGISRPTTLAQSLAALTPLSAPRAMLSHITQITSSTFGNGATQRLKVLNLQQKAALCALVALENRNKQHTQNLLATPSKTRTLAPTIKMLYATYCTLCTRDSILHPLSATEFRDVMGGLEGCGLVGDAVGKVFGGRGGNAKKLFGAMIGGGDEKRVVSCVGVKEVESAVEGLGSGILKNILRGEGLD